MFNLKNYYGTEMEITAQIVLSKRRHGGWECDVMGLNEEELGGGTGPTPEGVFDMAMEMIWEDERENGMTNG